MSDDALQIRLGVAIPLSEIQLRTSRSSGPGGQHANVTASRVDAIFDVFESAALSDDQKRTIASRCGPRVTAAAQDTRSQHRNRQLALQRLSARLGAALTPRKSRRPTAPSQAARRRRVEAKRRRSEAKRLRKRPDTGLDE